jgi:hypothetical protein
LENPIIKKSKLERVRQYLPALRRKRVKESEVHRAETQPPEIILQQSQPQEVERYIYTYPLPTQEAIPNSFVQEIHPYSEQEALTLSHLLRQSKRREKESYDNMTERPLTNRVRLEMPRYSLPLSRLAVGAFIERFQYWAQSQGLDTDGAKIYFPQAFTNQHAQNFFAIHAKNQAVQNLPWNQYILFRHLSL